MAASPQLIPLFKDIFPYILPGYLAITGIILCFHKKHKFGGVRRPRTVGEVDLEEFGGLALWERSTCLHGRDLASWEDIPGLHPLSKLLDPAYVPDSHFLFSSNALRAQSRHVP